MRDTITKWLGVVSPSKILRYIKMMDTIQLTILVFILGASLVPVSFHFGDKRVKAIIETNIQRFNNGDILVCEKGLVLSKQKFYIRADGEAFISKDGYIGLEKSALRFCK